jgi:hypothetical protein
MTTKAEYALGIRAFAYAQAGNLEKARSLLVEQESSGVLDTPSGYYKALTHTLLGEHEQAIDWLERSVKSGLGITAIINPEPLFDPLRSDPRFQAFLKTFGLS